MINKNIVKKIIIKLLNRIILKLLLIFPLIKQIIIHLKLKKKIQVIGLQHSQNIGNNLVKYAIYIKLLELGFDPYIVGMRYKKSNISFILNNVKVKLINNSYTEIKKNEFDILIANSDQTWRKTQNKHFYDVYIS